MLAISSLSRNSRYVGAMWVGFWVVSNVASGVLSQTVRQDWCPLVSYTGNLNRVREALLDAESAWEQGHSPCSRRAASRSATRPVRWPSAVAAGAGSASFGPRRRRLRPAAEAARRCGGRPAAGTSRAIPGSGRPACSPGLVGLSAWILATRVQSLDRLRVNHGSTYRCDISQTIATDDRRPRPAGRRVPPRLEVVRPRDRREQPDAAAAAGRDGPARARTARARARSCNWRPASSGPARARCGCSGHRPWNNPG